jgi:hypothetical protein
VAKSRPADDNRKRRPKDDDDAPRAKKRKPAKDDDDDGDDDEPLRPKKKRKSTGTAGRLTLRIFIGIFLAAGLAILLYWVYSSVGFDEELLGYLPEETYHVEGADVEELEKNTQMVEVNQSMIGGTWKLWFGERYPLVIEKEVARVIRANVAATEDESKLEAQRRRGNITVVKFRKTFDGQKFTDSYSDASNFRKEELKTPDGKSYHQIFSIGNGGARIYHECFYFPNEKTLLMTSTRREMEGCLAKTPGLVLKDEMLTLVRKVDGQAFTVTRSFGTFKLEDNMPKRPAFDTDFLEKSAREQIVVIGTGRWFASNGNDFLYGEGQLFSTSEGAGAAKKSLSDAWRAKRRSVLQNDSKIEVQLDPNRGKAFGGGAPPKPDKDLVEVTTDFVANSMVYRRGNMVIVSGTIGHPKLKKIWGQIGGIFFPSGGGFGFPGGGFPR